ncbi:cell wall-binding repeat-containing protein [Schumannella luteola]
MPARPRSRTAALVLAPLLGIGMLAASPLAASGIGNLGTIAVGDQPRYIDFSNDSAKAFVSNLSGDSVSVINTATATTVATIPVGDQPLGVAVTPDGTKAWVANWGSTTISIIDTATNTVSTTTTSGGSGPYAIVFTADGAFAYVTNYFNGVISKIEVATRDVVDFYDYGGFPEGAALNPDESALYVADTNSDQLLKIDTATMEAVGSGIPVGDFPVSVELAPNGTELWVTNNSDGVSDTVSVVSLATDTEVATIAVGGFPTDIVFDDTFAYVTSEDTNVVEKISVATRQVVTSIPTGDGPFGLAFSPDGRYLYVANENDDTVSDLGLAVDRIAGADRFLTSVAVSQEAFPSGATTVFVTNGLNYPDALAAGPAARTTGPVLLTTPTSLPSAVKAEIDRLNPTSIVVLGDEASVSAAVATELETLAPVTRIGGADRYATARQLVDAYYTTSDTVYLATGHIFPDALSAGAAGAALGIPLVLVYGPGSTVDAATLSLLDSLNPTTIKIVGGTTTVSSGIETQLINAGYTVERLAGANRFETSVLISGDAFGDFTSVQLATGLNYPDALAGAPLAAVRNAPLIAVQQSCIPASALALMDTAPVATVTLLGGIPSLGTAVASLTACP